MEQQHGAKEETVRREWRSFVAAAAAALATCVALARGGGPATTPVRVALEYRRMIDSAQDPGWDTLRWARSRSGPGNGHNDYAPYAGRDPWLSSWAGKGSLALWAADDVAKHGDHTTYGTRFGTHGLAAKSEEPDRLNRKNGWEQKEFFKWVRSQGGGVGREYQHALQRLGVNSFSDLDAFNTDHDIPAFPCRGTPEIVSAHADCGRLREFVEETTKAPSFRRKGRTTPGNVAHRMASVNTHVKNMLPTLSGNRPWDDPVFYCYSQFADDPEFSQCMHEIHAAADPLTNDPPKAPTWKTLTKGLWARHADGSPAFGSGDNRMMGATWKQLTADLWDADGDRGIVTRRSLEGFPSSDAKVHERKGTGI